MVYRGKVQNGVIVLDTPGVLPEGAEVTVRRVEPTPEVGNQAARARIGELEAEAGLPNLAATSNHATHGQPEGVADSHKMTAGSNGWIDEAAGPLARARLALEGLSIGDAFGERFFVHPDVVEGLIRDRVLPARPWD